jgi:hypothetical protein
MKQFKPGHIYKRLNSFDNSNEYFYIISISDTHIRYYYLDDPDDSINRPLYTVDPRVWLFVQ